MAEIRQALTAKNIEASFGGSPWNQNPWQMRNDGTFTTLKDKHHGKWFTFVNENNVVEVYFEWISCGVKAFFTYDRNSGFLTLPKERSIWKCDVRIKFR